jgi:hypothetical protein
MGMWFVPWAALLLEAKPEKHLIEDFNLTFVSSARECVPSTGQAVGKFGVILANPDYSLSKEDKRSAIARVFKQPQNPERMIPSQNFVTSAFPTVRPVPETEEVARSVKPAIEAFVDDKTFVFTGEQALETLAKKMLRPKVLLYLTHGFSVQETSSMRSTRSSSTIEAKIDSVLENEALKRNPLLRCGLLLAGCNRRDAFVGDDDGVLTGLEVASLDLQGTELVFLAACNSGQGELQFGVGTASLRQAFLLAGAKSVISTQWPVPIVETSQLTTDFFQFLADGVNKGEALRSAQLKLIREHREKFGTAHPYFWAGLTLTGR